MIDDSVRGFMIDLRLTLMLTIHMKVEKNRCELANPGLLGKHLLKTRLYLDHFGRDASSKERIIPHWEALFCCFCSFSCLGNIDFPVVRCYTCITAFTCITALSTCGIVLNCSSHEV